jgi:HEAT repeat protein
MDSSRPSEAPVDEEYARRSRRAELEELAAGHTVAELIALLSRLEAQGRLRERAAYDVVRRLAALVALDDAHAEELRALLGQGSLSERCSNFVAGALGSAGSPAAQAVLAGIALDDSLRPSARTACVVSLATVERPTREAEESLRALAQRRDPYGIADTSLLILGVMADKVSSDDSSRAASLTRFVLEREGRYRSEGQPQLFLEALGNAGSNEGYDSIVRYLGASSAEVRTSAVRALLRLSHPGVDARLVNALSDEVVTVRLAAVDTIARRPSSRESLEALGKVALADEAKGVRRSAIEALGRQGEQAAAREALRRVAEDDPDPELRALAESCLG